MKTQITVYALLEYDGKYLITQRADTKSNAGYWGCISGHIKEFESAEDAVIREVKEETNLEGIITKTGDPIWFDVNNKRWIILNFLVKVEDINSLKIDKQEIGDFKWIDATDDIVKEYKGLEDTFRALKP